VDPRAGSGQSIVPQFIFPDRVGGSLGMKNQETGRMTPSPETEGMGKKITDMPGPGWVQERDGSFSNGDPGRFYEITTA